MRYFSLIQEKTFDCIFFLKYILTSVIRYSLTFLVKEISQITIGLELEISDHDRMLSSGLNIKPSGMSYVCMALASVTCTSAVCITIELIGS